MNRDGSHTHPMVLSVCGDQPTTSHPTPHQPTPELTTATPFVSPWSAAFPTAHDSIPVRPLYTPVAVTSRPGEERILRASVSQSIIGKIRKDLDKDLGRA